MILFTEMDKKELRQYIRTQKRNYSPDKLQALSQDVLEQLENDELFVGAKRVMLYSSLPDEVQTHAFIEKWRHDKVIILPTVVGDDIIPVALADDTLFCEGDFHIMEPQSHPYDGDFDLIVVPGMAFDRNGNRLGRGKGFYDRFLSKHLEVPRIGICFDFQIVDAVPADSFDILVHKVLPLAK